jgi:DNA-binding CsgD family transcriptional regulator
MEEDQSVFKGWFTKDLDLTYTQMCRNTARHIGLEGDYHIDMQLTDSLMESTRDIAESAAIDDRRVMATGQASRSRVTAKIPAFGWVHSMVKKVRTSDGGTRVETLVVPFSDLHSGWFDMLDSESGVLRVNHEVSLPRKDMRLLHMLVFNIPRKEIAARLFISVKAVEKRISLIREKMRHVINEDITMHECLSRLGLLEFVAQREDWFNIQTSHIVQYR